MKTKHQKQTNEKFTHGDLVYIPQDVQLWHWGSGNVLVTEAPTTGIFLEEADAGLKLFIKGRRMLVKKAHVYPYTEPEEK